MILGRRQENLLRNLIMDLKEEKKDQDSKTSSLKAAHMVGKNGGKVEWVRGRSIKSSKDRRCFDIVKELLNLEVEVEVEPPIPIPIPIPLAVCPANPGSRTKVEE